MSSRSFIVGKLETIKSFSSLCLCKQWAFYLQEQGINECGQDKYTLTIFFCIFLLCVCVCVRVRARARVRMDSVFSVAMIILQIKFLLLCFFGFFNIVSFKLFFRCCRNHGFFTLTGNESQLLIDRCIILLSLLFMEWSCQAAEPDVCCKKD